MSRSKRFRNAAAAVVVLVLSLIADSAAAGAQRTGAAKTGNASDDHDLSTTVTLRPVKNGQREVVLWVAGGTADDEFVAVLQRAQAKHGEIVMDGDETEIELRPQHERRSEEGPQIVYMGHHAVHKLPSGSGYWSLKFKAGDQMLTQVILSP